MAVAYAVLSGGPGPNALRTAHATADCAEDSAHYSGLSPAGSGLVASAVSAEFFDPGTKRARDSARYSGLRWGQRTLQRTALRTAHATADCLQRGLGLLRPLSQRSLGERQNLGACALRILRVTTFCCAANVQR